jgi:hypothetical protein
LEERNTRFALAEAERAQRSESLHLRISVVR